MPYLDAGVLCSLSSRLGVRLDDGLFQRLVESRWDSESRSGSKGIDCEGFVRLYQGVFTPAITFGRHLRKAAGRGDDELGENEPSVTGEGQEVVCVVSSPS